MTPRTLVLMFLPALLAGCLRDDAPEDPAAPASARPHLHDFYVCPADDGEAGCAAPTRAEPVPVVPPGWHCLERIRVGHDAVQARLYTDGLGHFGVQYEPIHVPHGLTYGTFWIRGPNGTESATVEVKAAGFVLFEGAYPDDGHWGAQDFLTFRSHGDHGFLNVPQDVISAQIEGKPGWIWHFDPGNDNRSPDGSNDFHFPSPAGATRTLIQGSMFWVELEAIPHRGDDSTWHVWRPPETPLTICLTSLE